MTTAVEVSAYWAVIKTIELIDGTLIFVKAVVISSKLASYVNPVAVTGHSVIVSLVARVVVAALGSSSEDTTAVPDVRVIKSVVLLSTHCGHLHHQMCHKQTPSSSYLHMCTQ